MSLRNAFKRHPLGAKIVASARRLRHARPIPTHPAILMYHRIASETFDPWNLAVSPEHFEVQMHWLVRHRTVLPLTGFVQRHRERTLPRDAIAITFDDGYACNAETAAPVLEHLRIPATIFIAAGLIRRGGQFWWDELRDIVMTCPEDSLQLAAEQLEIGVRRAGESDWQDNPEDRTPRQQAYYRLWQQLQRLPASEIDKVITNLRAQTGSPVAAESHRLMRPEQVRAIRSNTIEIGSHAMAHASLPNLSRVEREREINESVAACEAISGARPLTFAYPFGDFDAECEELVGSAGFVCACTTERRAVREGDSAFALPRIQVGDWDDVSLKVALAKAG